jgi:hypothetical protein
MEKPIIDEETGIALNNAMICDNGRIYLYCYLEESWREIAVCKKKCNRKDKCDSWRKHITKDPIIHRRTKKEMQKEKENRKNGL